MPIAESGITLNFPDANFFRFENCAGYKGIQEHFKEMDVCWYDQHNDTLYIIELKDWGDGRLAEESDPAHDALKLAEIQRKISWSRIDTLFKKSVDSVSMFISILLNKPYAVNIQNCATFHITANTTIRLLSIINWTNPDVTYISAVHSKYREYFRPYARLFDIRTYVVMTKAQAMAAFPWVS